MSRERYGQILRNLTEDVRRWLESVEPSLAKAIHAAVKRFHPHCAPPRWSRAEWLNELYREAIVCALESDQVFDSQKSTHYEKFVYDRVCSHLKTFTNKEWKFQTRVTDFPFDEETGEFWEPVDDRSETEFEGKIDNIFCEELKNCLEDSEYELLLMLASGKSYRQVGKAFGKSHEWVRRQLDYIRFKIVSASSTRREDAGEETE